MDHSSCLNMKTDAWKQWKKHTPQTLQTSSLQAAIKQPMIIRYKGLLIGYFLKSMHLFAYDLLTDWIR